MGRFRWMMPASLLGRARLGTLVFVLLVVLSQLPLVDFDLAWSLIAGSLAALVGLLVHAVVTYVHGRLLPGDAVISAVLLVVAASGSIDPMGVVALGMCPLVAQSSYGSNRTALARIIAVVLAIPVTLLVTPQPPPSGSDAWFDPSTTMGMLMMMVLAGLQVRGVYLVLLRHEAASARSAVLSVTGHRLLSCREVADAEALVWQTALDLRGLTPGIGVASARLDGDEYVIDAIAGLSQSALEVRLPRAAVTDFDTDPERRGRGWIRLPLDGALRWRVYQAGTRRALLVGAARNLPADVTDSFTTLGTHGALAEGNCAAHAELIRQARHDQLTALPNRASLFARLASVVDASRSAAAGTEDLCDVLMIIDLDDFKEVNDTHGHFAGDELLIAIGARLTAAAGATGLAARFGGDEFALLLTGIAEADVTRRAEQVCRELHAPVTVGVATVIVGASIGVVELHAGMTAADHMRCADIAMYAAKARGKNRIERFDPDLHGEIATVSMMEQNLRHAITNDEIGVDYQPRIDLTTGLCVGIDSAPYWAHPTLGRIEPRTFLPLAERTNQTAEISTHILRLVCRQSVDWAALPGYADLRITTRITLRQLLDPGAPAAVADALSATGLPGHRLILEVPAPDFSDIEVAARMYELHRTGVRIAVDGLGNAALSALCILPLDQFSFHTDLLGNADAGTKLELIVAAGRILHLQTNALGVDTAAQLDTLRKAGISTGQGLHLAGSMTPKALTGWLVHQHGQRVTDSLAAVHALA